jgi:geranylgeranyl pyrophosphate synthase
MRMKGHSTKKSNSPALAQKVQILLEEKGKKALEIAKKTLLEEQKKIESQEVKEALNYFMNEYWHDVARPALLSITCEAAGGKPEITTSIAVPMILISGAVDIHDDIIDKSEEKYGKPTVYGKFGEDIAILVGDALLFKGLLLLHRIENVSEEKRKIIVKTINDMFFELGDAEALEFKFRQCAVPSPEEYLRVMRKKAADVEAHTRIAAILGNAREKEIEKFSQYGRLLGMLIILRDEILDLMTIDELKNRITKEHLPLPTAYAFQNTEIRPKLKKIFKKKKLTERDVKLIQEFTEKGGGIDASKKLMKKLALEASSLIKHAKNNRNDLTMLIKCMLRF